MPASHISFYFARVMPISFVDEDGQNDDDDRCVDQRADDGYYSLQAHHLGKQANVVTNKIT